MDHSRAPGAGAEPGSGGPRAAAGRPPGGEAGPLLKPRTRGREQPREGRGRGRSSARSLPEGDGPARGQTPTPSGVRRRLAEAPGSGRALSAGSEHRGSFCAFHVHGLRRRRGSTLVCVWFFFVARHAPENVRGCRDPVRKEKFARRGPNDLPKLRASLPGAGLSGAAPADLSAGGECPLGEGAAGSPRKEGCGACRGR